MAVRVPSTTTTRRSTVSSSSSRKNTPAAATTTTGSFVIKQCFCCRSSTYRYALLLVVTFLIAMNSMQMASYDTSGNDNKKKNDMDQKTNNHNNFPTLDDQSIPKTNSATTNNKTPYHPNLTDVIENKVRWSDWCKSNQFVNMEFSKFVNKHSIKEWIKRRITTNYHDDDDDDTTTTSTTIIETAKEYGYVTNASDITTELLSSFPSNRFLLKAAHLSGGILLVEIGDNNINHKVECLKQFCHIQPKQQRSVNNIEDVVEILKRSCNSFLQKDHSIHGELYYRIAEKGCVFEEVLELHQSSEDIKIYVFHGRPHIVLMFGGKSKDDHRTLFNSYTPYDWKMINFEHNKIQKYKLGDGIDTPPQYMEHILDYTQKIYVEASKEINHLEMMRVDFMIDSNSNVLFVELTFAPNACGSYGSEIQELYYGYLASNPQYDINPAVFHDIIQEWEKDNQKEEKG